MAFLEIAGGSYDLGLGHRHALPLDSLANLEEFSIDNLLSNFSGNRTVTVSPFRISVDPIRLHDLIQFDRDGFEKADTLGSICDIVDSILSQWGQRLPNEDEWEIALGPHLFPWGEIIPDGIPYNNETPFTGHLHPSTKGLNYNSSTYVVELCRTALKLGDGGAAVCGGYPWPVAWLSLACAHRLTDNDIDGCFFEFMEDAEVRAVLL
jgi:hypothetical protein